MRLHLRIRTGLQIGDECFIDPPGGFVGRSEDCKLFLRDSSVSRTHLELRFEQDFWWAVQHSTRSASMVDGAPVSAEPVRLGARGSLQVGGIVIEYGSAGSERAALSGDASNTDSTSPPTMINIRRQLPSIQQAVLPQMTPISAPEPSIEDAAPPTLIIRRPAPDLGTAPPTMIRPRVTAVPPPDTASNKDHGIIDPRLTEELVLLKTERDQLRLERDRLSADVQRLSQENASIKESLPAPRPSQEASHALPTQALQLLQPFSDSLEQASEALKEGDATRARTLLRDASFGLADLRDLFESSVA